MVQGEKKDFESLILSIIDRCCPDFRRDALSIIPVHSSFSDFQPVLYRDRDTVVAVLLSLPVDTVTVLVCLHLRKLTFTGAVMDPIELALLLLSYITLASINCVVSEGKHAGLYIMVNQFCQINFS